MKIEVDREEDGRWIAEIIDLPGAMVYGQTKEESITKVKALGLRILADRIEHGESVFEISEMFASPE
jgi:predicted RNase H-like HicB family nuclease